jgi:hypothetical protein
MNKQEVLKLVNDVLDTYSNDVERVQMAFDILEYAEVVEPVGDSVLIKIDKKMWDKFMGIGEVSND